jgi:hypothetical protein
VEALLCFCFRASLLQLRLNQRLADFVPDYKLSWEETYGRFYDFVGRQIFKDPEIIVEDLKAPATNRHASAEQQSTE